MAYEFTKLSEVEALNEVPENATVLAEVNGTIKRIPGSGLGGSDIKTAIIKSSDYDNTIAGIATTTSYTPAITYSCINMTFEEAQAIILAGEPLNATIMIISGAPLISTFHVMYNPVTPLDTAETTAAILLADNVASPSMLLVWTTDGITQQTVE